MKKKMTVLGGLMMAVVLTGYSVAGTYAKYTESASASDNATIAKWDVTVSAGGQKLFNSANNNATVDNRVAPGGHDEADWGVAGIDNGSEVKVAFSGNATLEGGIKLEISEAQYNTLNDAKLTDVIYTEGGKYYYAPVVLSVSKNGATAVKSNRISELSSLFGATTTVNEGMTFTIGWNWAFTATDLVADASAEVVKLVNDLDTKLGTEVDPNNKIEITATATIEQDTMDRDAAKVVEATSYENGVLASAYGYNPSYTEKVIFTTNGDNVTLSGTIKKNTNEKLIGSYVKDLDQTGYYYPVIVKGEKNQSFTITNNATTVSKNLTTNNIGSEQILVALDKNAANKTITIEIGGKTITYDYSSLTFAE